MKRIKVTLNSKMAKPLVNVESYSKVELLAKQKPLPVGDINEIVNVADRFNTERQSSTKYRLNGTVTSLMSNVLFNVTGVNSFQYFMTNPLFRDRSYPPDAVDLDQEEDLTFKEAIETHLREVDGWFGYYDPDYAAVSNCVFYDMAPSRDLFTLTPKNGVKNWELTVTYPESSFQNNITLGGLLIVEMQAVTVNGRSMTAFGVPARHNLKRGSIVRITGLSPVSMDADYEVMRLGLDNGDMKEHFFCLDIPASSITLTATPRMARMHAGEPSEYYFRVFKKVNMANSLPMETDDYEIYPLAFSKNIYNDPNTQFVINEDVDIANLTDNLGRPLSELYITLIKTDSGGEFSEVKSGMDMPYFDSVALDLTVPDARRITNAAGSHMPLEIGLDIQALDFIGDLVEYHRFECRETVIGEILHRFNTINRDNGGSVTNDVDNTVLDLGVRSEGYIYRPHHRVQLRDFSSYIEQGDSSTEGIPDYAVDLGDGRYLWRDVLDIGFNDIKEKTLDYPFLNGAHYIHSNMIFAVKRQDPFNKYNIFYSTFPRDGFGDAIGNNHVVKRAENGN